MKRTVKIISETRVDGEVLEVSDKSISLTSKVAATLVANYKAEYVEPEAKETLKKKKNNKLDKPKEDKS